MVFSTGRQQLYITIKHTYMCETIIVMDFLLKKNEDR